MEGIMFKQIEKLQQDASRFVWPAIATLAVIAGGGAAHEAAQAATAKDHVGMVANAAFLILGAAGTAHGKRLNQLGRDENSGFLDKRWRPTINKDNFVSATKRYKDLDRQSEVLMWAPWAGFATAGATAIATAAFAPAAAVIGCIVAPTCMGFAAEFRKVGLRYDLRDAADAILEGCDGNTADPAVAAAYSFLKKTRQL